MTRVPALMTLAALLGCAAAPGAIQQPAARPTVALQGGEVEMLKPTDEQLAYGGMAAIAIRQSRFLTSTKTVGLYQGDDPKAPLYPIIKIILENNPYREIHPGQAKVACTVPTRPGLRGGRNAQRTCGLDVVDVLLQVNSVQIMRDTGYVGGYITEVMPGEDRAKSQVYCFKAVWRQHAWIDVRNSIVKEPRDCAAPPQERTGR